MMRLALGPRLEQRSRRRPRRRNGR